MDWGGFIEPHRILAQTKKAITYHLVFLEKLLAEHYI
jgi:hypothetical protein